MYLSYAAFLHSAGHTDWPSGIFSDLLASELLEISDATLSKRCRNSVVACRLAERSLRQARPVPDGYYDYETEIA